MSKTKPNNTLTERGVAVKKLWDEKLQANFESFFVGKPALKKRFVECIQRIALVNPTIVQKYSAAQLTAPLLKAAEWGLVPDNNECTIVEVKSKPACWIMANGVRKRILDVTGVKYCSVESVYENEQIVYNKLSNVAPVVCMKDGMSFFDKGNVVGAIAFVEMDDGRIILSEVGVGDAKKYKPAAQSWHYSDKWMSSFLENIVVKLLYKKLPKQFDMPTDAWDETDKAGHAGGSDIIDGGAVLIADETPPDDTPADTPADTNTEAKADVADGGKDKTNYNETPKTPQPDTAGDGESGELKDV